MSRHFTASFSVIRTGRSSGKDISSIPSFAWSGSACSTTLMPTARSMVKKRCGLPIAAIACTGWPENSRNGLGVPYFIAIALQSIVLQPIVADDDVAAGIDQQLCRHGAIAPSRDRNTAAACQQDGLIADLVGIIGGLHQPRGPR